MEELWLDCSNDVSGQRRWLGCRQTESVCHPTSFGGIISRPPGSMLPIVHSFQQLRTEDQGLCVHTLERITIECCAPCVML